MEAAIQVLPGQGGEWNAFEDFSCKTRAGKMLARWILLLTFVAVGAIGGDRCGVALVSECFGSLVHYETLGFPLYGRDELNLDETCNHMNQSFDCVYNYIASCNGHENCSDECREMIADIGVFSLNTGLQELQQELCDPDSAVRLTYLENYECLEGNADQYAACHNDSQLSQEFLTTIKDGNESVNARCCFFSWYQDCFTNITKDSCNGNATFFVSFSLHKLIGHIAQHTCQDNPIVCTKPPLPTLVDSSSSPPFHAFNGGLLLLSCFVVMFTYVFAIK